MQVSSKVILLTGATGLLGNHVAAIAPHNCRLIAIGRNPAVGLPSHVEHLSVDLADPELGRQLPSRIDAVIHLAQSRRFREFPDGAADIFAVNTRSTALLLDHAVKSGCKDFIYASTGGVYKPGAILTESSQLLDFHEMQIYPASKLAAEALLGSYARILRVVSMRIFFMYGEGQHESMLIPRLAGSIRKGSPISLTGKNGFRFNPLYVKDAASLVWAILDSKFSGVLNVAGSEELTLEEVCRQLGSMIGVEPVLEIGEGIPVDFRVNLELLKRNFGQMETRFEVGARAII
jgi:nucleoside-diphosphate-sugar epimerase